MIKQQRLSAAERKVAERLAADAASLHWYALYCPPQKEFAAQAILKRYGLETYVPVRRDWRKRNKFTKTKELRAYPLAPRYIFAGFPPGIPLWFDLFRLPLITGVVGIVDVPMRIDPRPLARLMALYPNGIVAPDEQRHMATGEEFAIGDEVLVIDGPFDGLKVPVKSIKGDKATVTLQLFAGAVQELDLPIEILQAA